MLYSNTILKHVGVKANVATPILNGVNFLATIGGLYMLSRYGRRTLMLWGTFAMVVCLTLSGLFSLYNLSYENLSTMVLFIGAFEFTSGPITWLYMSEIM
jgi:uncharacterized membrane protein